ncbi:MAG: hypothetical protein KKB31_06235 [Nanoarchaeota archaeon]|nr:hypothetical protein [Nanoarchaeota archaeon]
MNTSIVDKMVDENFKLDLAKLANDASIGILLGLRQRNDFINEQLKKGIKLCAILTDALNIGVVLQESRQPYQQLFSSTSDTDINLLHFVKEYKNYINKSGNNIKTHLEKTKLIKNKLEDILGEKFSLNEDGAKEISEYFFNISSTISETLSNQWDEIQY